MPLPSPGPRRPRSVGFSIFRALPPPLALLLGVLGVVPRVPAASPTALPGLPGETCRAAIVSSEQSFAIPSGLLGAIGQVESGRRDPLTGATLPWPWTVDADGDGHFYPTKEAAIAAVQAFQEAGIRSIDVGCMQVNLLHHPGAFSSLEQAFDPSSNAAYAARFLRQLRAATQSWAEAAAFYHSTTPGLAVSYEQKVMAAWPAALREAAGVPATLPTGLLARSLSARSEVFGIRVISGPFAGGAGSSLGAGSGVATNTSPASGGFVRRGIGWYRAARY